jgi:hypothetical protein
MPVSEKNGTTLVPEMMDEAVLKTNLLEDPVTGRDNIARVLETLSRLYRTEAVSYRKGGPKREYIVSSVILSDGEGVEATTVGLRDDSGWICAVDMHHEPRRSARILSEQLKAALSGVARRSANDH